MNALSDLRVAPRRHSKLRIAMVAAAMGTCRLLGGRAIYRRRNLRAGRFLVRRELLEVDGLPEALAGFQIAHLSDLHAGPFLREGDLAEVVAEVNRRQVDLCVLTGDFITESWRESLLVLDDLAQLKSRFGTCAVFGNHDYRGRKEGLIVRAFGRRGIRFLRDQALRLPVGSGATLAVVGLEDLEESKGVDAVRARASLQPGDWELVLCHNPQAAPLLARKGCLVVLSGHTHGNQINWPWFRDQGPPHPGERVELGEPGRSTTLVVSRGLGAIGLPLRVGAPAEVVLLELKRSKADPTDAS